MLPGVTALAAVTPKALALEGNLADAFYRSVTIDADARDPWNSNTPTTRILAGCVIGKRTSDSKYMPVRRTTLSAQEVSGQTVLSVTSVLPFTAGLTAGIINTDGTTEEDLGAIVTVGASTITVTTSLSNTHASGSYVYIKDGSEDTNIYVLADNVDVVDEEGTARDALAHAIAAFEHGLLNSATTVCQNYDAKVATDNTHIIWG